MKRALALALIAGLSFGSAAWADEHGPWDFSFTAGGGDVPDLRVGVFPLFMNADYVTPGYPVYDHIDWIESMELEITGLHHPTPADFDIWLIDPFGNYIEIMTDLGNQSPISGVDLIFNDKAATIPGIPIASDTYRPEGLYNSTDAGMSTFYGGPNAGGTDSWILLIGDDDANDVGGFTDFTLRGTVPEPLTLSLLAVGALATLRRRR